MNLQVPRCNCHHFSTAGVHDRDCPYEENQRLMNHVEIARKEGRAENPSYKEFYETLAKAEQKGRADGFKECTERQHEGWIEEGRQEERARILAALPEETNEHGDDESDYITQQSRNATLDEVRFIINNT